MKENTSVTSLSTLPREVGSKSLLLCWFGKPSGTLQSIGSLLCSPQLPAFCAPHSVAPITCWGNLLSSGGKTFTLTLSFPPNSASVEILYTFVTRSGPQPELRSFHPYLTLTFISSLLLERANPCCCLRGLCWAGSHLAGGLPACLCSSHHHR